MRKNLFALAFLAFCPLLVAQQAMNNDSIEKLVKAKLSDELIVASINTSPGSYDTSADALIALKKAGASDKVIAAMMARASGIAPAASAPSSASAPVASFGLPAGISDVGVYLKDKSGSWTALLPEIVNFKTGGVLKSIVTVGIVKGDINGHIAGPHAKTGATFPVLLAVYVPEGTEITEYQLLRLRPNGDSREFRSVTGGVLHESGGAQRDSIEFQPEKIANRVYQITLAASTGVGEYGLLPPGAYGSSNMGSSGKIYTVSITQ